MSKFTAWENSANLYDGLVLIGRNPQNNDFGVTIYFEWKKKREVQ